MTDVAIRNTAVTDAPKDYTLPGQQEILLKAVIAEIDGTSAAGPFLPALQLVSDAGDVMWTAVDTTSPVAAGGSATVSWFPLRRFNTVSQQPSPNPLGTVWAWYDFSDTSTITLDGSGNISQIVDKTGNGHDLNQATAGNRPGQTTINTLNAGLFASASLKVLSGGPWSPGLTPPYTALVVNTLTGAAAGDYYPGSVGGPQLGTNIIIQTDPFSRPFLQLNASSIVDGGQPQPHTQYLFGAIVDGASSVLRVNGVSTTGTLDTSTLTDISVGAGHVPDIPGTRSFLDGAIGEVLYYTTHLSATQLSAVEAYLKAKWNTP